MSKLSQGLFSIAKSPLGDLIVGIAFGKLSNLLPIKRIKETERALAFHHPKPFWETHILIVPKKAIKNIASLRDADYDYIQEIFRIIKEIVIGMGLQEGEYSVITNGGSRQEVNQLHFHLFSGKEVNYGK